MPIPPTFNKKVPDLNGLKLHRARSNSRVPQNGASPGGTCLVVEPLFVPPGEAPKHGLHRAAGNPSNDGFHRLASLTTKRASGSARRTHSTVLSWEALSIMMRSRPGCWRSPFRHERSEEHTSELQSPMYLV